MNISTVYINDAKAMADLYDAIMNRQIMGVIELPIPVINRIDWYSDDRCNCQILGLTAREVDDIMAHKVWAVTDPGTSGLIKKQLLTFEEIKDADMVYGVGTYTALTGVECLMYLWSEADLDALYDCYVLKEEMLKKTYHDITPLIDADPSRKDMLPEIINELLDARYMIDSIKNYREQGISPFTTSIRILPDGVYDCINGITDKYHRRVVLDELWMAYQAIAYYAGELSDYLKNDASYDDICFLKRKLQYNVDRLICNNFYRGRNILHHCLMDVMTCSTDLY